MSQKGSSCGSNFFYDSLTLRAVRTYFARPLNAVSHRFIDESSFQFHHLYHIHPSILVSKLPLGSRAIRKGHVERSVLHLCLTVRQ